VPGLIGRTNECEVLDEALDAVRDGHARVLVLRGEPGIGKTSLLQHLVDVARGFTVAHATGVESEMELPFAALHQLCAPMLDHLNELPEPQRIAASTAFGLTVGSPPDRLLIGLAILNLFASVSESSPLLCVVDDAHWLDHGSAQTLAFVGRRLFADKVALVFATRSLVGEIAQFSELHVEGLGDDDARTLLTSFLRAPLDERVRDRIVAESGGNPLALIEWPRRRTPAELAGGFTPPDQVARTSQIETAFRQRVAELPFATRRFLTVAAADPTGDPVTVWRAANSLGLVPTDATPAIDGGLIEIGVRLTFRHPLVRSVAYTAVSPGDRQEAHRALAESTDPELEPDRRAWHRALGSPGPDEEISEALERSAGRALARGGLAAAAALLERSVALTIVPAQRTHRILAAADAQQAAGSFERSGALLAAAEATPLDDISRAQLDRLRASHALFQGNPGAAAALGMRAAERLESLDVRLAFATYLAAMGAAAMMGEGDGQTIRDVATATIKCPESEKPTELESLAIGLATMTIDGSHTAVPLLRKVLSAEQDTLGADAFRWLGYTVAAAGLLWDLDTYRSVAAEQVADARAVGALSMLPNALNTLAGAYLFEGDLDAAASAVREAAEILAATGSNIATSVRASHAALEAGEGAAQRIDEQLEDARVRGAGHSLRAALWARATLGNGAGEYETALVAASEAIELSWAWSEIQLHEHVEAAVRCGQRDLAAITAHRLAASTTPSGTDWALGIQRRCEALLADDDASADGLYRQAIEHLTRTRLRPEVARAHLLYGEWLRRSNRRVDARAELQAAYDMFASMGINAFTERTRHELLLTGATVRKRTPESYAELTSQELAVSRLAVEGLTNAEIGARLFISVRTVEWHLRKVFTKLGISSRRELSRVLPTRDELSAKGAR
jgi:DNA-binding CsgD family transcriptional regulator